MIQYKVEKRHYPRLIFSEPETIAAVISMDSKITSVVSILNMSEGGLQISLKRGEQAQNIRQGGRIILKRFKEERNELSVITDIPMQAVWIMDNEYLDHVLIGVAFTVLSDEQHRTISSFIEACIASAEQEHSKQENRKTGKAAEREATAHRLRAAARR